MIDFEALGRYVAAREQADAALRRRDAALADLERR